LENQLSSSQKGIKMGKQRTRSEAAKKAASDTVAQLQLRLRVNAGSRIQTEKRKDNPLLKQQQAFLNTLKVEHLIPSFRMPR
jgi:hypothetical protein